MPFGQQLIKHAASTRLSPRHNVKPSACRAGAPPHLALGVNARKAVRAEHGRAELLLLLARAAQLVPGVRRGRVALGVRPAQLRARCRGGPDRVRKAAAAGPLPPPAPGRYESWHRGAQGTEETSTQGEQAGRRGAQRCTGLAAHLRRFSATDVAAMTVKQRTTMKHTPAVATMAMGVHCWQESWRTKRLSHLTPKTVQVACRSLSS